MQAVLELLGGPRRYRVYTLELGSAQTALGYHGFIALAVFVRAELVASGAVAYLGLDGQQGGEGAPRPVSRSNGGVVRRGRNLGLTRASNKGAVGLPFRCFDATLAFVTCHLSSDLRGHTYLQQRNEAGVAWSTDSELA